MSGSATEEPVLAAVEIDELGRELAGRLLVRESTDSVLDDSPAIAPLTFAICGAYGHSKAYEDQLAATLEQNPARVLRLLAMYLSVMPGLPGINAIATQGFHRLIGIVPQGVLIRAISKHFPSAEARAQEVLWATPDKPNVASQLGQPDGLAVLFLLLNTRFLAEVPPGPPTIYEPGVGRSSPFRQGSPSDLSQGPDEVRPDLVMRILIQVPADITQFDLGGSPHENVLQGAQREQLVISALNQAQLVTGSWSDSLGLSSYAGMTWQLAGNNRQNYTSLALGNTDLRSPERPSLAANCSVMTGMCIPLGGSATNKIPGLQSRLDLVVRLASPELKLKLEDLVTLFESMLGVISASFAMAQEILPTADYTTGELESWLDTGRSDLRQLMDLDGPNITLIDGFSARREVDVHTMLPLVDADADVYGMNSNPLRAERQLAVYLVRKIYDFCGYRGYASRLRALFEVK
jgi:hypothetical protein